MSGKYGLSPGEYRATVRAGNRSGEASFSVARDEAIVNVEVVVR